MGHSCQESGGWASASPVRGRCQSGLWEGCGGLAVHYSHPTQSVLDSVQTLARWGQQKSKGWDHLEP